MSGYMIQIFVKKNAASDLGLHCLPVTRLGVSSNPFRGLQSLLWVKLYPYYNNEFAEMRDHITRAIQ